VIVLACVARNTRTAQILYRVRTAFGNRSDVIDNATAFLDILVAPVALNVLGIPDGGVESLDVAQDALRGAKLPRPSGSLCAQLECSLVLWMLESPFPLTFENLRFVVCNVLSLALLVFFWALSLSFLTIGSLLFDVLAIAPGSCSSTRLRMIALPVIRCRNCVFTIGKIPTETVGGGALTAPERKAIFTFPVARK
jgi:hypothetical protein